MEAPVFIGVTFIPSLVGINFWREFPVTSVTFHWNLIHGFMQFRHVKYTVVTRIRKVFKQIFILSQAITVYRCNQTTSKSLLYITTDIV